MNKTVFNEAVGPSTIAFDDIGLFFYSTVKKKLVNFIDFIFRPYGSAMVVDDTR